MDPEIVQLILEHDIVVFQETFLRPGEERTLQLPRGYMVIAMSRPDRPGLIQAWGGVAVVMKSEIQFNLRTDLSGPDLIVLDLIHMFLIGAYLLPMMSTWRDYTDVDPAARFSEAVTVCSICPDKPMMAVGDINARIAERIARGSTLERSSLDKVLNTRGRWLLRLCSDTSMTILNGTSKEVASPGAFTSFQALGSTVIDFVLVSAGLLPRIQDRSIRVTRVLKWSDHAQIEVGVTGVGDRSYGQKRLVLRPTVIHYRPPTALDRMAQDALIASVTPKDALRNLYGPVTKSGRPISVFIASSAEGKGSSTGCAAFSLYWGASSSRNMGYRFEGSQTSSRAALFAVLMAVTESATYRSLTIYTTSEYVIRSFCYWAGDNATRGWSCTHADVLKEATARISQRAAPIEFRIPSASAIGDIASAQQLAKDARKSGETARTVELNNLASMPKAQTAQPGDEILDTPKVFSAIPEMPIPKAREVPELSLDDIVDPDDTHRGRQRFVKS